MKKQHLKQHCVHVYLIGTGTESTATRICFNPSCSLGLTPGSSSSDSVSCVCFFFFRPSVTILYCHIGLVN